MNRNWCNQKANPALPSFSQIKHYQVLIYDDLVMTMTYSTSRSDLIGRLSIRMGKFMTKSFNGGKLAVNGQIHRRFMFYVGKGA